VLEKARREAGGEACAYNTRPTEFWQRQLKRRRRGLGEHEWLRRRRRDQTQVFVLVIVMVAAEDKIIMRRVRESLSVRGFRVVVRELLVSMTVACLREEEGDRC
jgi:hypothetical protein